MLIVSKSERGLRVFDPDQKATTGRWCAPPQVPDLCYRCFSPKTFAHYKAEYYYEEEGSDGRVWRYGACRRCRSELERKGVKLFPVNPKKGGSDDTGN